MPNLGYVLVSKNVNCLFVYVLENVYDI